MTNIQIPPGLLDENIELFSESVNHLPMALHNGSVKPLFCLPAVFIQLIENDLSNNSAAELALELAGFKNREQKILKYTTCRFGAFDNTPDIKDGKLLASEYFECGHRGKCTMEGIVCSSIKIKGRVISPFEISMIKLLATEDTLPVIAEKLCISMNNFETKKKILFEKLEVFSRARLVAVAFDSQILQPCSS